jgi:hypothetical protein
VVPGSPAGGHTGAASRIKSPHGNRERSDARGTSLVMRYRLNGDEPDAETALTGGIDQLFAVAGLGQVRPELRDIAWVVRS